MCARPVWYLAGSLDADARYLDDLFDNLGGTGWINSTGWANPDADVGDRYGVTVGADASGTECVSRIVLEDNNLEGE